MKLYPSWYCPIIDLDDLPIAIAQEEAKNLPLIQYTTLLYMDRSGCARLDMRPARRRD